MKLFYLILTSFFSYFSVAQNLISNPSFENFNNNNELSDWETTAYSPDYYHVDFLKNNAAKNELLTPYGKGYIGLLSYEIISTKLLKPLLAGQAYIIKLFAAKTIFCPNGIREITVAFTKSKLPRVSEHKYPPAYSLKKINLHTNDFKPVKKQAEWVEFTAFYIANGTEIFFYIDFTPNEKIKPNNNNEKKELILEEAADNYDCSRIFYDNVSIEPSPLKKNKPIIIDGINFLNNKSNLLPSSVESLDKLFALIIKLNSPKLKIIGHTDNVGDSQKNKTLSQQRANNVMDYLIKKGISKSKLIAEGLGDSKPLTDNSTEEGRAKNRRVEIEILE